MATPSFVAQIMAGITFNSPEFGREDGGCGWATVAVLLLLFFWQLVRAFRTRRAATPNLANFAARTASTSLPLWSTSIRISNIITDADLKDLVNILDGKSNEGEKWEEVISKKNGSLSYCAKCCRTKDVPLKYRSVTIFDKCSTELLRDFYMDNHYRKNWDKTLVEFEQLEADEDCGIEIGRMVKKFPLLTPREYIMAWRIWEDEDKTFYCFTKDCEHPLAPRQKKYVRVGFLRSGWRIRKVPGTNSCEVAMIHQEDAGLNAEMAKLAFSKGIWSYVCKMNNALYAYSTHSCAHSPSSSVAAMKKLIRKVPAFIDSHVGTTGPYLTDISSNGASTTPAIGNIQSRVKLKIPSKWIANGLILIGGIACLSRVRSTLGTQIAVACVVKKFLKHGSNSEQPKSVQGRSSIRESKLSE